MKTVVDRSADTWVAAFRLAGVASLIAAAIAVFASVAGDVPQAAIVLPVIVVAFVASWIQSGRPRRTPAAPSTVHRSAVSAGQAPLVPHG